MSLTKQNLISHSLLYHVSQDKLNLETDTGNKGKIFYLQLQTIIVWISDFYNSMHFTQPYSLQIKLVYLQLS